MANDFQDTLSGKAELKDYYNQESEYEAIKRKRKKAMEKNGLLEDDSLEYDKVNKPLPDYK